MVKIRKAVLKDIPRIDEIYVEGSIDERKLQFPKEWKNDLKSLKKHKKQRLNQWKKDIKSKKQYNIVAEKDGEVIAMATARIKSNILGRLDSVNVKKRYRNMGIGKKLISERLNWLKKNKIKKVELGVYVKNIPSIKLHEKIGFKKVSYKMIKDLK